LKELQKKERQFIAKKEGFELKEEGVRNPTRRRDFKLQKTDN